METTGPKTSSWKSCMDGVTSVRTVGLVDRKGQDVSKLWYHDIMTVGLINRNGQDGSKM